MSDEITLDIVTVTKNDLNHLSKTYESILGCFSNETIQVNWIVIDGSEHPHTKNYLDRLEIVKNVKILYQRENTPGIYAAMNQGLSLVQSQFFVLINSGDILLRGFVSALKESSPNFVNCFESEWHDMLFQFRFSKRHDSLNLTLGKMPNHQAMIFPLKFVSWKYDERFKTFADQDLKFRLASSGLLAIRAGLIVSSLLGGLSSRKLKPSEAANRSIESLKVFKKNLNFAHAIWLWMLYSLRFLSRINLNK